MAYIPKGNLRQKDQVQTSGKTLCRIADMDIPEASVIATFKARFEISCITGALPNHEVLQSQQVAHRKPSPHRLSSPQRFLSRFRLRTRFMSREERLGYPLQHLWRCWFYIGTPKLSKQVLLLTLITVVSSRKHYPSFIPVLICACPI